MLRRKSDAPAPRDSIDAELLEAVDEGLGWKGLLVSASCPPGEAEARLLRLLHLGYLEGEPYDNARGTPSSAAPAPTSQPAPAAPAIPPPAPARSSAAPAAYSAGESLLRELARRSGVSFPPVQVPGDSSRPRAAGTSAPPAPAPSDAAPSGVSMAPRAPATPSRSGVSMPPSAPSTPARSASGATFSPSAPYSPSRHPSGTSAPPVAGSSLPPRSSSASFAPVAPEGSGASLPPAGDPYGSPSSMPPGARPPSDPARSGVDSPLMRLIHELGGGPGMQRWTAARLREALHEEIAGNFAQAVSILQVVMAQVEDPRIRAERDRIQAKVMQANSGVYRKQAIDAERSLRHNEAAEAWRKVLEAQPNDADAALHGAMCFMEAGNLKQAGALARRAVELAPNSINAHRLLYRFFRKTGMEASAKRESEILAKLRKV